MRNGDLFVLSEWESDPARVRVVGKGKQFDPMRHVVAAGSLQVPIDSVAVFETNVLVTSGAGKAIGALMVVTAAVALYCANNPKACFGSCPTFYLAGIDRPVAEGFSASIAPSLEATDIDALPLHGSAGAPVEIVMKNEALETHVVRYVNLLALPRPPGTHVYAAADGWYRAAGSVSAPSSAVAEEGDCLAALRETDGIERFSLADSTHLGARESIDLVFAKPSRGRCGVVIACRQSLLSTFLLYQTLAYMGTETGHWIAELERGRLGESGSRIVDLVGGLEVHIESSPGVWTKVGAVREFGPIAVDDHLITFDAPSSWTGRVRLQMAQGGWRIDRVGLVEPGERVDPIRLAPTAVSHAGAPDPLALAVLLDPKEALVTLPGDTYSLVYSIPDGGGEYDLFLESRGYYLEWIREDWLRDESPEHLAEVFLDPERALTRLAPKYKRIEPDMEAAFWSSRYAK